MEISSSILTIVNVSKSLLNWILKLCGRKMVKFDIYEIETVKTDMNYPGKSQKCIEEKENGSKFRWSNKFHPGYKKYYEINGNKQRYFQDASGGYLWIKRQNEERN